jgi:hypothetical protein
MAASSRATPARLATFALTLALMASAALATPALAAATTPFQATFAERTTFVDCPRGTPPGSAVCFTGQGEGVATPGGPARESYRGAVVSAAADPVTNCVPDYNAVSISTARGTLYLVTRGMQCPPTPGDRGNWTALGGTGIFANARGSGTVATTGITPNPDGTISSSSTYVGTLTTGRDRDR